jgi:PAS domain-containing protein
MPAEEIELILTRQLANYLNMPIFIVGMDGDLLFYNEAAGELVGRPYDEAGQLSLSQLEATFHTMNEDGTPLRENDLPVTIALRQGKPAHRHIRYRGLDGVERVIEVTAFPLDGHAGRRLGAVAIFWEAEHE